MTVRKLRHVLFALGFIVLPMILRPSLLPAAPTVRESKLSADQQASLTAALAQKTPFAEIIDRAVAAGMDCEEIVLFLCAKSNNFAGQVHEIVYAAITGGCDAGKAVSGALLAGAPLQMVVRAARAAGASREVIAAAALGSGYSAAQVSNAFAVAATSSGPIGGGSIFDGPIVGGSIAGGAVGGGAVGGGAGGDTDASPSKPRRSLGK